MAGKKNNLLAGLKVELRAEIPFEKQRNGVTLSRNPY